MKVCAACRGASITTTRSEDPANKTNREMRVWDSAMQFPDFYSQTIPLKGRRLILQRFILENVLTGERKNILNRFMNSFSLLLTNRIFKSKANEKYKLFPHRENSFDSMDGYIYTTVNYSISHILGFPLGD